MLRLALFIRIQEFCQLLHELGTCNGNGKGLQLAIYAGLLYHPVTESDVVTKVHCIGQQRSSAGSEAAGLSVVAAQS